MTRSFACLSVGLLSTLVAAGCVANSSDGPSETAGPEGATTSVGEAPPASSEPAEAPPAASGTRERITLRTADGATRMITAERHGDRFYVEGDMEIPVDTRTMSATIPSGGAWRWDIENGYLVVDYYLDGVAAYETMILAAIDEWQSRARVIFRRHPGLPLVLAPAKYIRFVELDPDEPKRVCKSPVGAGPAGNTIFVGGCGVAGSLVHEIGHSLGLLHEQNRSDRDRYVRIIPSNHVESADMWDVNFVAHDATDRKAYDFASIMHYGSCDFARKECSPSRVDLATIVRVNDDPISGKFINAQRTALSELDVEGFNDIYGLAAKESTGRHTGGLASTRKRDILEMFDARPDGSIRTAFSYVPTTSTGWGSAQIVGAGTAPANASIASVARTPENVDIFYLDSEGTLRTQYWSTGGRWEGFPIDVTRRQGTPGGKVTAVARNSKSIDVFYAGKLGQLFQTSWTSTSGWMTSAVNVGTAIPPYATVTAVARTADHLDLFWIGYDGELRTAGTWSGARDMFPGSLTNGWGTAALTGARVGVPGGVVAALSRSPGNLDVFFADAAGRVASYAWTNVGGWKSVTVEGSAVANPGAAITAVARTPNNIDIYFVGADRRLKSSYWFTGAARWTTFQVDGAELPVATQLTAVSRHEGSIDVVYNRLGSMFRSVWYTGKAWATERITWNDTVLPAPNDTSKVTFFDTVLAERNATGWGWVGDINAVPYAQAARVAFGYCTSKGYVGGQLTGYQGGDNMGVVCFPTSAVHMEVSQADIKRSGWEFWDINTVDWGTANRAAAGLCFEKGYAIGYFNGHMSAPGGARGLVCLPNAIAPGFYATDDDIKRIDKFTEVSTVPWAKASRVATSLCAEKHYVGGLFNGHQAPGIKGMHCFAR